MKNKKDVLQDIPEDTDEETIPVDEEMPPEELDEEIPPVDDVIDEPIPVPPQVDRPSPFSFEGIATGLIPKPAPKNELADLFEVPHPEDNDMYVDDLFDAPDEEVDLYDNLDDLTQVKREDVMGRPPKKKIRYARTLKPVNNQSTMGSIQ